MSESPLLIKGDCLKCLPGLADNSIDMVLADPPYGTTACKWDSVIPLQGMWEQLLRLIAPKGAIVMTASQPFTTTLISSNLEMFKYCWVWEKSNGTNFLNAKFQPFKVHEDVVVFSRMASSFSKKGGMSYNPQMGRGKPYKITRGGGKMVYHQDPARQPESSSDGERFPRSVLRINEERGYHPTQKPVCLMEYLIKTYTSIGDTVLDFCMGSGTTGVACMNTGRAFIGIEKETKYFEIAEKRLRYRQPEFVKTE